MIHTWTWIIWLVGALVLLSTTRNPLYLILVIFCLTVVYFTMGKKGTSSEPTKNNKAPPVSPLRIALLLIVLSAIFNALVSHFGTTELLRLPGAIPLFGGVITLEGLVYGAITGLVLFGIFWSFMIINQILPVKNMIRLIPRAFYPVAVITSIAVTFVPTTIRQYHQIREAQAVRGHRLRGLRDWLPLLMPLMISGLERAMDLSEAMTARGFASSGARNKIALPRLILLFGLLLLLAGWIVRLNENYYWAGNSILVSGLLVLLGMFWFIGRLTPRSTYMRENWGIYDGIIILGALLPLAVLLIPWNHVDRGSLAYNVYPSLSFPSFDPTIGIVILGLLAPAVLFQVKSTKPRTW